MIKVQIKEDTDILGFNLVQSFFPIQFIDNIFLQLAGLQFLDF